MKTIFFIWLLRSLGVLVGLTSKSSPTFSKAEVSQSYQNKLNTLTIDESYEKVNTDKIVDEVIEQVLNKPIRILPIYKRIISVLTKIDGKFCRYRRPVLY